jgi:lysophospholipase L1-like esterase
MKSPKLCLLFLIVLTWACHRQPSYQSIGTPYTPNYSVENNKNDIEGFKKQDAAQMPAPGGIVITGSSSFRLWKNAGEDLAPLPIINRGFGGSTTPEMIHYIEQTVLKYKPKVVVTYVENDMFVDKTKTPEQTRDSYVEFTRLVREQLPDVQMYYVSMKPSPSRWARRGEVIKANRLIDDFTKKDKNHGYIDVWPTMLKDGRPDAAIYLKDSLHMNAEGYRRWTEVIKPVLAKGYKS